MKTFLLRRVEFTCNVVNRDVLACELHFPGRAGGEIRFFANGDEKMSLELLGMWGRDQQTTIMVTHSISEAVLLADRVLVFSRRPGKIIAEIPVMLPRPRRPEMLYDPIFTELTRQVRSAIDIT